MQVFIFAKYSVFTNFEVNSRSLISLCNLIQFVTTFAEKKKPRDLKRRIRGGNKKSRMHKVPITQAFHGM